MLVNACASCDSGEVNSRTYRVKATIVPYPATAPLTSSTAPTTHTATYPKLPMNAISGCIRLEKNCDFHALVYSL